MSDHPETQSAGDTSTGTSTAGSANTDAGQENAEPRIPKSRFDEVNNARKQAEAELAKLKAAEEARLEKERLDKGQHEQVIAELKPKAERALQLEATLKEYLQGEIDAIPADLRTLVPAGDVTQQLAWIKQAKAAGLFAKQTAPNTDAGARGDSKAATKVTPEHQSAAAIAQQYGYDIKPEALAATQRLLEERRRNPNQGE